MKNKILSFALIFVSLVAAAQVSLVTFELSLPGCPEAGTNSVAFSYPGVQSIVAPVYAFAPDTNGNISVGFNTSNMTNFVVKSFVSGSRSLDLAGIPPLRYGQSYSFTCAQTNNTGKIIVTAEVESP